ncbi:MAG: helix-turn-helix domain-containing protein [Oscillospiraceae bacterium]|nr:helix-turn-helix domain-containing protein [Oscillospiraceae bacterium]
MAGYAIVPDIDAPELTATDIAVWAALCRFADWELDEGKPVRSKAGTCYPSQEQIAQRAHLTDRAVRKSLARLEALGYIRKEGASRRSGQFTPARYTLFPEDATIGTTFRRNDIPTEPHSATIGTTFRRPEEPRSGHIYRVLPNPYTKPNDHAEEAKPAADTPNQATLGRVAELWNRGLCPLGFPMVVKETPARKKAFQARVNEARERRSLAWWEGVIGRLAASGFMRDSARNKAGWLTLDWLLNENNLVKVLEGRYDERRPPLPQGRHGGSPSMAEYLAELRKDPFFGGEEDANDGRGKQARDDGVRRLPEGGGRPVWTGPAERRGGKSFCPAAERFEHGRG